MATISWNAAGSPGDWGFAANWVNSIKPRPADTVSLAATRPTTITVGPSNIVTVAAIISGAAGNDTITIAGGTLSITGDAAIGSGLTITSGTLNLGATTNLVGDPGALVTNAGMIAKAAGTGTATVSVATVNTGTISVGAGSLRFTGAVIQNGNLVAADGATLALTGGGTLGGSVSAVGTGQITFGGDWTLAVTSLSLTANLGFTGSLSFTSGQTLTLAGSTILGTTLKGSGKLITLGPVSVNSGLVTGGAVWSASAGVTFAKNAVLSLKAGTLAITNAGSVALDDGSAISSFDGTDAVTNAGAITKSAGTGNAGITASVTNTGSITATSGQIQLNGTLSNSGTLAATGATFVATGPVTETGMLTAGNGGSVQLTGGGTLGGSISTTGTGQIALLGGWTLSPGTLAWNGAVSLGGTITFASGQSFALGGSTSFSGAIHGPGTLTTSGPVSVQSGGVQSGAIWSDSGAMTFAGNANLVLDSGALAIAAGGSIALSDGSQVTALTGTEHVANAGSITKTNGTGSAQIGGLITNTGTISVTAGTLTIGSTVANSGTMHATGATLALGTISGTGGIGASAGGTIVFRRGGQLGSFITADDTSQVDLTGGTFTVAGPGLTWAFQTALAGPAVLTLAAGQTFTLSRVTTISGADVEGIGAGGGTLVTTNTLTETGAQVGGGATWQVSGTVNQHDGGLLLGTTIAGATGTVEIVAGGTFNLADDNGISGLAATPSGPPGGIVSNAGMLAKTGGAGTSTVSSAITNTGTIEIDSGTLDISGLLTTTGAINIGAAGILQLTGGAALGGTLANHSTHQVVLGGANFTVGQSGGVWAGVDLTSALQFTAGQTFTFAGTSTLAGTVTGAGTLTLAGTTAIGSGAAVTYGATLAISGSASLAGTTLWLDNRFSDPAGNGNLSIVSGGSLSLVDDQARIGFSTGDAAITNAGTLAKTGGTGVTQIQQDLINTGTIAATAGTISLSGAVKSTGTLSAHGGSLNFGGKISQTGAISIDDGDTVTMAGGGALGGTLATAGSGALVLTYGTYALSGTNVAWAGTLNTTAGITLAAGQSLVLAGNDTLAGSFYGAGSVTVAGTSTLGNNAGIGLGLTMTVTGKLRANTGTFNLFAGDGVTQGTGTLAIAAGGTFELSNNVRVDYQATPGTIANAGTITTGSDGSSPVINALVTNTGTIVATSGLLQLGFAVANSGTITANGGNIFIFGQLTGGGTLNVLGTSKVVLFGGGSLDTTFAVASTATLTLDGTWSFSGAAHTLSGSIAFIGTVAFTSGQVLTLASGATAAQGAYRGAGRLLSSGTVSNLGVTLSDGAVWEVSGTVTQGGSGTLALGDSLANAGGLQIDAGAIYRFSGNSGITTSLAPGTVTNAGTLAKSGGTGTSIINANIANTGTIAANSGTLALTGTVTSSGTISIAANARLQFGNYSPITDTLGGTITNNGELDWVIGGTNTITTGLTNNGLVDVQYGTLAITGAIGGTGQLKIEAGGTLELGSVPTATQSVQFNAHGMNNGVGQPNGAKLVLDRFGALAISGLAKNDAIDLAGVAISSAVISGNVLTLTTTGGATAALTSSTSLDGLATQVASDGHGGSLVTLFGNAPAVATLAQTTYTYTNLTLTDHPSIQLNLTNSASTANGMALNATIGAITGPVSAAGSISGLQPGQVDPTDLVLTVNPSVTGAFTATVTVNFTSVGATVTTLPSQTITITGTVLNNAVPRFVAPAGYVIRGNATIGYTLDLGSLKVGYAPFAINLGETNAAQGPAADLGGFLYLSGSLINATGQTAIGPLAAGATATQPLTINSAGIGVQTETVAFDPAELYGGYRNNLPRQTLTIIANVVTDQTTTYALDGAGGVIYADAYSNSIFQITAPALRQSFSAASGGWYLRGGPGQNQLQLIGPGTFDLRMLVYPQALGTIEAHEGQRAYGSIAGTRQGVILRDGDSETLVVNSGTLTAGNPNQLGIDIVAGTGTYMITLGAGHDHLQLGAGSATVRLGRPVNQVIGGDGTAAIVGNLLQCSGALIQGNGTGAITLYATVAGAITLNGADRNLTVALKAGSTLNMGAGSGIVADGRAGSNVITLQASAQTAIGGNGTMINGAAAGGDTFQFYKFCGVNTVNGFIASGANHDTLAFSTKAFADWAHLLGATKAQGNDLLITIDASNTVLLKNVSLASFVSSDARFF